MTKPIRRIVPSTLAAVLTLCATARGQEDTTTAVMTDLNESMKKLTAQMAEVTKQLRAQTAELKSIRTELKAVRAAQAPRKQRQPDTTVYKVKIGNSPALGPSDARVTIVEFSDLQCPFCVKETPKLKQVLKLYPKDVRLVFKNYPLPFHKKAPAAHAAAMFADKAGKFWEMHDLVVANPKKLDVKDLRTHAETLQLDLAAFDTLMKDPVKIKSLYATDLREAARCKVRGTPTILVNGVKLVDRSINGYKARIAQILKKSPATKPVG